MCVWFSLSQLWCSVSDRWGRWRQLVWSNILWFVYPTNLRTKNSYEFKFRWTQNPVSQSFSKCLKKCHSCYLPGLWSETIAIRLKAEDTKYNLNEKWFRLFVTSCRNDGFVPITQLACGFLAFFTEKSSFEMFSVVIYCSQELKGLCMLIWIVPSRGWNVFPTQTAQKTETKFFAKLWTIERVEVTQERNNSRKD